MRHLPDVWREVDRPFFSPLWRETDRPLALFGPMLRQWDNLFNEMTFGRSLMNEHRSLTPSTDIEEKDDYYLLSFDMPGIDKQDIDVAVQGNRLFISGEHKQDRDEGKGRTRFSEHSYRRFEQSMNLPTDAKTDNVEAEYHNGVLSVVIPKSAESKRHQIKIGEGKTGFFSKLLGESSKKDKNKAVDVKVENQVPAH